MTKKYEREEISRVFIEREWMVYSCGVADNVKKLRISELDALIAEAEGDGNKAAEKIIHNIERIITEQYPAATFIGSCALVSKFTAIIEKHCGDQNNACHR